MHYCIESVIVHTPNNQAIVWDRSLFGPFRLNTKYASLNERNVVSTQFLSAQPLPDMMGVKHIIFICRPQLAQMDDVAAVLHAEERKHTGAAGGQRPRSAAAKATDAQYHMLFVPRVTRACEDQLKAKGVYGSLSIAALPCELFAVDADLVSMELPNTMRDIYAESDPTALYACASALHSFQRQFGRIGRVYGKGQCAQTVWQLCKTMQRDGGDAERWNSGACVGVDQLIILDRAIDMMSVLATQLTYEGLIDEHIGIHQCAAKFPADAFASAGSGVSDESLNTPSTLTGTAHRSRDTKDLILNSADEIYADLRDKHVHAVGGTLSKHAKSVAAQLNIKDKPVQEIRQMVDIMPRLLRKKEAVARHTSIAHMLKLHTESAQFLDELSCEQDFLMCENCDRTSPYIEDMLGRAAPLRSVLRLMCMQCQAGNGLKAKVLDYYKRELVQVYGIQVLLTIGSLERAGLLRLQTGARTYAVLRKTLALTVEDVNELQPRDISYVHTSYAPLSVRIVEKSLKKLGWHALHDVLSSLPGPTFQESQQQQQQTGDSRSMDDPQNDPLSSLQRRSSLSSEMSLNDQQRVIMVFFVGGCTFAEVSALRFLAQENSNVEFVIGTTKLLNKNSLLDEFIEGM